MTAYCPTCGGAVEVVTADEGTSSYRPVDSSTRPHLIPDAAVVAAGQKLKRHMIGDDLECVPKGATLDVADGWVRAIDMAAEDAMPAVLTAALPHLLTDEMVERAARAVHEVSDDVLPFDLHVIEGMGRRDERVQQNRIDERRERYLTTARAALEAALGNAA